MAAKYTIDEIRNIIAPIAKRYGVAKVSIFGSYAKGTADEDSDVDLLVDLTNSNVHGIVLGGLYNDLEEALGVTVDLVTVANLEQPTSFRSDHDFRANIERERMMIYATA